MTSEKKPVPARAESTTPLDPSGDKPPAPTTEPTVTGPAVPVMGPAGGVPAAPVAGPHGGEPAVPVVGLDEGEPGAPTTGHGPAGGGAAVPEAVPARGESVVPVVGSQGDGVTVAVGGLDEGEPGAPTTGHGPAGGVPAVPVGDRRGGEPAVSVVGPRGGETILLGTTRMRVLEDGSHTGHRLGITESVLAPHTPGPPQHRHAEHDESFYVLSGSVRFTVGEDDHDATVGTLVTVPPGVPHTFANVTDRPAVMLSVFTPDLYVQYFRDLQKMIAGGRLTPRAGIETMSRYATSPVTAPGPA